MDYKQIISCKYL